MRSIGLLIPNSPGPPPAPEQTPIGRAALGLVSEGIEVVFAERAEGGILRGHVARPGRWETRQTRVYAAIDRFPSFSRPADYATLLAGLSATPVHNPPTLTALLRDKVRTQLALGGMPEMQTDARRFVAFLERGPAFHKPRFGSFGRGVHLVREGDETSARALVDGVDQPMFLQRAVRPPDGIAGAALRILVHRTPDGWRTYTPVARVSRVDPVVNRARGAEVMLAEELEPGLGARAELLGRAVAKCFPAALELGVDAVVDDNQGLHVIEVNARPRGRLAVIAQRPGWEAEHLEACSQPFRTLAME